MYEKKKQMNSTIQRRTCKNLETPKIVLTGTKVKASDHAHVQYYICPCTKNRCFYSKMLGNGSRHQVN